MTEKKKDTVATGSKSKSTTVPVKATAKTEPKKAELAPKGAGWLPSSDVYRSNGNLVVRADLPGLGKDDVAVRIEDGFLVIEGARREEKKEEDKGYYWSECSYGSFYRRVPLPDEVDVKKISAKVHDGVLEVTVPVPAVESKAVKQIEVT